MAPSKLKDFIQTVRACKVRRTRGRHIALERDLGR